MHVLLCVRKYTLNTFPTRHNEWIKDSIHACHAYLQLAHQAHLVKVVKRNVIVLTWRDVITWAGIVNACRVTGTTNVISVRIDLFEKKLTHPAWDAFFSKGWTWKIFFFLLFMVKQAHDRSNKIGILYHFYDSLKVLAHWAELRTGCISNLRSTTWRLKNCTLKCVLPHYAFCLL